MIDHLSEFSELQTAYKFRAPKLGPSPEGVKIFRGILIFVILSLPIDYLILVNVLRLMR